MIKLYLFLHENSIPKLSVHLEKTWDQIIEDPNHHLIVNEIDSQIVSSCVCVIIPNLTRNIRPYAFVENVVTHADYRGNFDKRLKTIMIRMKLLFTGSRVKTWLLFCIFDTINVTDT